MVIPAFRVSHNAVDKGKGSEGPSVNRHAIYYFFRERFDPGKNGMLLMRRQMHGNLTRNESCQLSNNTEMQESTTLPRGDHTHTLHSPLLRRVSSSSTISPWPKEYPSWASKGDENVLQGLQSWSTNPRSDFNGIYHSS